MLANVGRGQFAAPSEGTCMHELTAAEEAEKKRRATVCIFEKGVVTSQTARMTKSTRLCGEG